MRTLFVLLTIQSSPIAAEVVTLLDTCEEAVNIASTDPGEIPAQRALCLDAALDDFDALDHPAIADPAPFQARLLGAWRVFDAAVATGGANGMDWTNETVKSAANDVRRMRYEVAQQVAVEAQP